MKDWDDAGIDAYISRVNPAVALRHGDYSKAQYFAHIGVSNVLDYPAYTLTMGFVDPSVDLIDDVSLVEDAAAAHYLRPRASEIGLFEGGTTQTYM